MIIQLVSRQVTAFPLGLPGVVCMHADSKNEIYGLIFLV
jgi:hypothetical protein